MKTSTIRSLVLAALTLTGGVLFAAEPPKEDAALAEKLIGAVVKSDHAAFIADGAAPFRQLKKEQFEAISAQLAPRFAGGYQVSYLGELTQKSYHVTLWKISFTDGGDDVLATLSVKDGKVGGFFIR